MSVTAETRPHSSPEGFPSGLPTETRLQRAVRMTLELVRRRPVAAGLLALAICAGGYFLITMEAAENGEYLTATVARGDIEDSVTAVGNLQPRDYVDVGAQVSGQLKKLYVDLGDEVKQGELIAEIDPQVLTATVETDKANLANLMAQLSDRSAQTALAKAEFDRQKRLMAANATSRSTYDAAQQSMKSSIAQVAAIRAQIEASKASLAGDEVKLGYTKIYSPMDGTIVSITTKQGMTINANQTAPVILRVADLSVMTVWTQVSEADVPSLRIGMPAYFTTLGQPGKRYTGKLSQVQPTPDVVNNVVLYTATFDVQNPDNILMTQMTAQVFFVTASAKNVIVVPVSALKTRTRNPSVRRSNDGPTAVQSGQQHQGTARLVDPAIRSALHTPGAKRAFVEVVKDDGTLERRMIVVGVKNRVSAQVLAGLDEGEKVVTGRKVTATASPDRNSNRRNRNFGGPRI